jgi:hypothetical protein
VVLLKLAPAPAVAAARPPTLLGPLIATRQWQPAARAGISSCSLLGEGSLLGCTRKTTAEDRPAGSSHQDIDTPAGSSSQQH